MRYLTLKTDSFPDDMDQKRHILHNGGSSIRITLTRQATRQVQLLERIRVSSKEIKRSSIHTLDVTVPRQPRISIRRRQIMINEDALWYQRGDLVEFKHLVEALKNLLRTSAE